MAVPFDTPVSAIEGIGPTAESLFQQRGVHTVYDLLRASSPALHRAVESLASVTEVRRWRQMAVLLEVAAMTPQWAEALVTQDVTSLADLRRLELSELQALFRTARDAGTIPDLPDDDQLAVMLKDATLLDFAGAITGTVTDRDDHPVVGATVATPSSTASTDARGRFRIRRLLANRDVMVNLSHSSFQAASIRCRPLPTRTVSVQRFVLQPAVSLSPRHAGQASTSLSEVSGDAMPPMQGQDFTSREVPLSSLRQGDLLTLTLFYANGDDAKLVSKLLEFDGSQYVARWVRLPKTALPADSAIGDFFIKTGDGYREVAMNPRKLAAYKRFRQARQSSVSARAATIAEIHARAKQVFAR